MFRPWKRRPAAPDPTPEPIPAPAPATQQGARAGGSDVALPASAGDAQSEPPARAARPASPAPSHPPPRAKPRRPDARYARRYSPEERRAAVEAFEASGRTREDFAKLWGCSAASLDKWRKRLREEGPKALEPRRRSGPRPRSTKRLPDAVRDQIAEVSQAHTDFGVTRIASHLHRFHGVSVSPSTVRNVLRERGIALQPTSKRRSRPKSHLPRRFERARPGELWQTDITSFVLRREGRRVYLTVFLDDHSRFVVAWALATHQRTPLVTEPLLEGIARFGKPREVLSDQGRQYYAWRGKSGFQKLLAKEGIAHVVSRAHHPETLGKCERLWKTVGEEFWDRAVPQDLDDARQRLGHWFAHYNHFRPHQGIDGLVPADRFFGAERALREALERELSANELRQALDEAPRRPVYLVGQIGEERIALHGERGRLVIETPGGGRREIAMQDLGIERTDDTSKENGDERDEQRAGGGDAASGETGERSDAEREAGDVHACAAGLVPGDPAQAPPANGPQALGLPQGSASCVAGARSVGERTQGREGARAHDVHGDPGLLAGQEEQERGRGRARDHGAAGVAALAAGALGDDGGPPEAAAPAGGTRGLRAQDRREPERAEAAHRAAREGPVANGGPGARAADGPVGERERGDASEGRSDSWSQHEGLARQGAPQDPSANASDECCGSRDSRGRRWWRWLKRTE